MSRLTQFSEWLLRQPLLWGGLAAMAFYALVVDDAPAGSLTAAAFAGALWQFKAAATVFCFTGLAALALRLMGMVVQYGAMERPALPAAPAGGQCVADAVDLLEELNAAPPSYDATYLGRRLRRALELVRQRDSANQLEADLRQLAADDRRDLADRDAAVRLLAISTALAGLAGAAASVAGAMSGLSGAEPNALLPGIVAALGPACGGVVQALGLTIVLLFARLGVERAEQRLLDAVDAAAGRQLLGRFVTYGAPADPQAASVQRAAERVLETVASAAERHDAALSASLTNVTRRWEDMAAAASSLLQRTLGEGLAAGLKEHSQAVTGSVARLAGDLQTTLVRHAELLGDNIDRHTGALADALEHHAAVVTQTEQSLAAEHQRRLADMEAGLGEAMLLAATRQEKLVQHSEALLRDMQAALLDAAGTAVAQQQQLVKQGDVLLKVVEATGQIRKLEEALNSNLLSLSASHNFEQTVTSLAAAVQLLSVRLRQPAIVRNEVDLGGDETTSQAA